jgi:hypothetical protein
MSDSATGEGLIGQPMDHPSVARFLSSLGHRGQVSEDSLSSDYHLAFESKGVSILFTEDLLVRQIAFFVEQAGSFLRYQGPLPCGLEPGMSLLDVHSVLGEPSKVGGGIPGLVGDVVPYWDAYGRDGWHLTVTYNDERDRVVQVSLVGDF